MDWLQSLLKGASECWNGITPACAGRAPDWLVLIVYGLLPLYIMTVMVRTKAMEAKFVGKYAYNAETNQPIGWVIRYIPSLTPFFNEKLTVRRKKDDATSVIDLSKVYLKF